MLEIEALQVSYGGVRALRGVSLAIAEGASVAIVGPNGAGKTTLLNALSGLVKPSQGSVRLDGENIAGIAAHVIARRGLIQVPEGRRVLAPMTVEENLLLGRHARGARIGVDDLDRVYSIFPILAERRSQLSGSLSGGQQQMMAIGRALMSRPRLLMLDEPSLGLSPIMATEVFKALSGLNADGLTLLLVEQNARRAFAATQYAYVLEGGRIAQQGECATLANDPAVIEHYLGAA